MELRYLFLFLGLLCVSAPVSVSADAGSPILVSMIELISNKEKYDGKLVEVGGYISLTFEDDAIYLGEQDFKHQFTRNAIWIDVDNNLRQAVEKNDRKYGYIIGTFSAKNCGQACLYSGSIHLERVGLVYKE
jgi:hypothetical protein